MRRENECALVIAYYLSKFDTEGLERLGYNHFNTAFQDVGQRLGVNPNSVKNMRDEFDSLHLHRRGWHQRPLRPSREAVVEAFEHLSEPAFRSVVKDLVESTAFRESGEINTILQSIREREEAGERSIAAYASRGRTGEKAETTFVDLFYKDATPFRGTLHDRRQDGAGYDFEVESEWNTILVEVKGIADRVGGIRMTDKEWRIAEITGERYFLVVISNLNEEPELRFVRNPYRELAPQRHIATSVTVSWDIPPRQLFGA